MRANSIGYVWGPINAEDLAPVPGSDWIITSGMIGAGAPIGRLYAVHRHDRSCSEITPYLLTFALDSERFGAQEPLDPLLFQPHGIDLTLRPDGIAELYVVNHGKRESVEVFEVLLCERRPALRWIGGVQLPGSTVGNDVAVIPGSGFVVSTTGDPDGPSTMDVEATLAGADTGGVLEWSVAKGWTLLPGTQINIANGVAVSKDGEWVFVGGWNSRCIKKVRRGGTDPETQTVSMPIMVDNLTWSSTGSLLAAGAFDTTMQDFIAAHMGTGPRLAAPSRIVRVDPDTLATEVIIEYGPETFAAATTGIEVDDEMWVGTAHDQGLARFRYR